MKLNKLIITLITGVTFSQVALATSHYDTLKAAYSSANASLTKQDLLGAYLGRCFTPHSDDANGMILSTVRATVTTSADEGPLFPPVVKEHWRMALAYKGVLTDAAENDTTTQADIDSLWTSVDGTENHRTFSELEIVNSTATCTNTPSGTQNSDGSITLPDGSRAGIDTYSIRKGADGLLYGEISSSIAPLKHEINPYQVCYFWKKIL